jgi:signal transduction histidine kinase
MVAEDMHGAREVFINALRSRMAYVREFRISDKKGEIKWIQERSCIVYGEQGRVDYVSGIFFDISERKQAEEELKKYRDRLEELVQDRTYALILANQQLQWEISERKQAEQSLQKVHEELERRVEKRTEELRHLNIELRREIEERILAEKALRESREELQFLTSELITTQESERRRISRELHDELGQALAGMKMHLVAIEGNLRRDQRMLKRDCARLLSYIDEIAENVRRLSWDLSPVILEVMGLSSALEDLFSDFTEHYHIGSTLNIEKIDDLFSKPAQTNIYRLYQECLTNIIRHSQATHFSVVIQRQGGHVLLAVQDNGKGFNVKQILTRKAGQRGIGIAAMHERVRMLGGSLEIWSQEGSGTRIAFSIPVDMRAIGKSAKGHRADANA